jgi:hypothetical protein
VNPTERGAHAGVLFDEIDAALQIVAAEKDVIEHRRHLVNERHVGFLLPVLHEARSWRDCGHSEMEKSSARKGHDCD